MKRPRTPRTPRLSRDATQLVRFAVALSVSGSRIEDAYWLQRLEEVVTHSLDKRQDEALESALDQLWSANPPAYDELAQAIEGGSECLLDSAGQTQLLVALPILAWSRYNIPSGAIPAARLAELQAQLHGHVLAADTRLALADVLFSPDQLPRGFVATRTFARTLASGAATETYLHLDTGTLPQTAPFIADVRYVLGVVSAAAGAALFRWQEGQVSREQVAQDWQKHGSAVLQPLLPACSTHVLLPNAYFHAWRESDMAGRGFSVLAGVAYLGAVLNLPAAKLNAVVAPFYDEVMEEYRVGFAEAGSNEVLHGVVWPLIGSEDDASDIGNEIETLLRGAGVGQVLMLSERMPLEYCDDCGAPLFPNAEGELVHAQIPESAEPTPHLH